MLDNATGQLPMTGDWQQDAQRYPIGRSHSPAYLQIAEFFRARIAQKVLVAGDQIPTENDIMASFSVSRHTARNAIQSLVVDGLLAKFPGKGTFVLEQHQGEPKWAINSFASFMNQNYPGTPEILDISWVKKKNFPYSLPTHAKWPAEPFLRVTLVRRHESKVYSFAFIDVTNPIGKKIKARASSEKPVLPVMKAIEEEIGILIDRIRQTLTSVIVDETIATHLGVEPQTSALKLSNIFFDSEDNPIEVSQIFFPADAYEHNFEIYRGDGR